MMRSNAHMKPTRKRRATGVDNGARITPQAFFDWLNESLRFTIDVAASASNAKCVRYFTEEDNALVQSWKGEVFFCQPPYGRALGDDWFAKGRDECMRNGTRGAFLVPVRAGSTWWRRYVMQSDMQAGTLRDVRYLPHTRVHWYTWERLVVGVYVHHERLDFEGQGIDEGNGAPFDSAVVMMGPRGAPLEAPTPFLLTYGWPR